MTREIVNPQWDVSADNGGGVIMRLVVPGSKFGAVHIRLDGADARELAHAAHSCVRDETGGDAWLRVSHRPQGMPDLVTLLIKLDRLAHDAKRLADTLAEHLEAQDADRELDTSPVEARLTFPPSTP